MKPACLDSSAWIEITHNGPNARTFLKAAHDINRVIVSTITLYEVWKYTVTHADETRAQHLVDLLQQGIVIPPDTAISIAAANLIVMPIVPHMYDISSSVQYFRILGVPLVEVYGLTESTGMILGQHPDRIVPGTVGEPILGVEHRLGEAGELLIRGDMVFEGYYKDPEQTRAALQDGIASRACRRVDVAPEQLSHWTQLHAVNQH